MVVRLNNKLPGFQERLILIKTLPCITQDTNWLCTVFLYIRYFWFPQCTHFHIECVKHLSWHFKSFTNKIYKSNSTENRKVQYKRVNLFLQLISIQPDVALGFVGFFLRGKVILLRSKVNLAIYKNDFPTSKWCTKLDW